MPEVDALFADVVNDTSAPVANPLPSVSVPSTKAPLSVATGTAVALPSEEDIQHLASE
jgi:hypothetical protein